MVVLSVIGLGWFHMVLCATPRVLICIAFRGYLAQLWYNQTPSGRTARCSNFEVISLMLPSFKNAVAWYRHASWLILSYTVLFCRVGSYDGDEPTYGLICRFDVGLRDGNWYACSDGFNPLCFRYRNSCCGKVSVKSPASKFPRWSGIRPYLTTLTKTVTTIKMPLTTMKWQQLTVTTSHPKRMSILPTFLHVTQHSLWQYYFKTRLD